MTVVELTVTLPSDILRAREKTVGLGVSNSPEGLVCCKVSCPFQWIHGK